MTRDQVAKYLQGAKAYNDHLAQVNTTLKTQLNSARQIEKPNIRKVRLAQIDKAARTELKDVDKRLALREKAVDNLNWGNKSDEAVYRQRAIQLKAQRAALVESINQLNTHQSNP